MKKILFLFGFVWLALAMNAQSHFITVSNTPDQPAQYSDLQTAINAAQPGDTIYVMGSLTNYGSIGIEKDSITLIGAGFDPLSYNNISSKLDKVELRGAAMLTIKGFYINQLETLGIYNSTISDYDYVSDIVIENNYINSLVSIDYYTKNMFIRGCVVEGYIMLSSGVYNEPHIYGIVISNSYLYALNQRTDDISYTLYNDIFTYENASLTASNGNVRNCIFYYDTDNTEPWSSCGGCVFENNLFYNSNGSYPLSTSDTNITNHNLVNQDPQFVNFAKPYSATADYHLKSTSPGHNYGTDGQDIGIYGASYDFNERGQVPIIPVITHFSIDNPTLQQNDTLKVRVKVITNN